MKGFIGFVVVMGIIWLSINQYQQSTAGNAPVSKNKPYTNQAFRCDGRTHCSHMTSCAEAEFFIKNCPNTKMDGDGDGLPCERQWCNY